MVKENCPGSRPKPITTDNCICPVCRYEIEFFLDEDTVKCPKCKHEVFRKDIQNTKNK